MIGGGGCLGEAEYVADGTDIRSLSHSMFRCRQVGNKIFSRCFFSFSRFTHSHRLSIILPVLLGCVIRYEVLFFWLQLCSPDSKLCWLVDELHLLVYPVSICGLLMSTISDMPFYLRWVLHSQKVRWTTALNSALLDTISMSIQMLQCKYRSEVGEDHNVMAVPIADPLSDKCSCSFNPITTIVLLCAPSFP